MYKNKNFYAYTKFFTTRESNLQLSQDMINAIIDYPKAESFLHSLICVCIYRNSFYKGLYCSEQYIKKRLRKEHKLELVKRLPLVINPSWSPVVWKADNLVQILFQDAFKVIGEKND